MAFLDRYPVKDQAKKDRTDVDTDIQSDLSARYDRYNNKKLSNRNIFTFELAALR
ncbi:hypothetical protein [Novipirellula aureliae]|uniref:hypothetical protein n=1 Tax=Novipirellula aureliae TaxID=2527966 RepID=UPI0018CCEC30|nr:hypothetical protein [Novipirellula aureliae]